MQSGGGWILLLVLVDMGNKYIVKKKSNNLKFINIIIHILFLEK